MSVVKRIIHSQQPQHPSYYLTLLLLVGVVMNHTWSARKQRLHLQCSRDKLPFSFVRGQDSTVWDIVWVSPQGNRSVSVSHHFLLQALQCSCSVRKWFSRDHCCRGTPPVAEHHLHLLLSDLKSNFHGADPTHCLWHAYPPDCQNHCYYQVPVGEGKTDKKCWHSTDRRMNDIWHLTRHGHLTGFTSYLSRDD